MHAICSISEPQPSTCNLFAAFKSPILPAKYLSTTYVLAACCLHVTYLFISSPVRHTYDQQRIYTLLIRNPTLRLYLTHCMPVCNLS